MLYSLKSIEVGRKKEKKREKSRKNDINKYYKNATNKLKREN